MTTTPAGLPDSIEDLRALVLLQQSELAAQADENLMPLFIEAVESDVTLGEIFGVLRGVWGENRPVARI